MLALLPFLLVPLHSQAGKIYNVFQLPEEFIAADINNAGQMTGSVGYGSGSSNAALYSQGVITDLGTFGASYAQGKAINDAGAVTGVTLTNGGGASHAFLYADGKMTDIGAGTDGLGINATGDVVGQKNLGDGRYTGFVYRNGTVTEFAYFGAGTVGVAQDINDDGKIVGASSINLDYNPPFHPFLYSDGTLHDLGALSAIDNGKAQAIDNAGRIAGTNISQDGIAHAFIIENGVMTDAGTFGEKYLSVNGINELGVFVGGTYGPGGGLGFIYQDDTLIDLNTIIDPTSGWKIDDAFGINDAGQIVARGCRNNYCGSLLLDTANAVPEPGEALMLLPGLMTLAAVRRRARYKALLRA